MGMHISTAEQLGNFAFDHLKEHLQAVSAPFALMATHMVRTIPSGPGLTRALGHLRRAKDEAVTATIAAGKSAEDLQESARAVMGDADAHLVANGSPFNVVDQAP